MCTSCVPIHPSSYRCVGYHLHGLVKSTVLACVTVEADGETFNFVVELLVNYYRLAHLESNWTVRSGSSVEELISYAFSLPNYKLLDIRQRMQTNKEFHVTNINGPFGRVIVDWEYREAQRLETGEYLPIPDIGIDFDPDHFIHRSTEKDQEDYVAYTPSDAHGLQNRQTRIRLGRYLKKYFPSMTDAEVVAAVDRFKTALAGDAAPFELKFTTDCETINEIFETKMYANGSTCESCMYNKFTDWTHRPYHVYADSPDVAVAYLVRMGEIVARSVVSTKDKLWVRLYSVDSGDSTLCKVLRERLEAEGYEHGDLSGNRLTRLPDRGRHAVLPYIDGDHGVDASRCGKYWIVGGSDYCADQTDGLVEGEEEEARCSRCDNLEEDCSCIYCECCQGYYPDGCDECSMCPECEWCITHDNCTCDRCGECNELEDDCDCPRCEECNVLESQCECKEVEEESETNEPINTTPDVEVSTPCMVGY